MWEKGSGSICFLEFEETDETNNFLRDLKSIFGVLKMKRFLKKGDGAVIKTGFPIGLSQWTNVISVEVIP